MSVVSPWTRATVSTIRLVFLRLEFSFFCKPLTVSFMQVNTAISLSFISL